MIVALNNKSNLDKNEFIKYLEELSTIVGKDTASKLKSYLQEM